MRKGARRADNLRARADGKIRVQVLTYVIPKCADAKFILGVHQWFDACVAIVAELDGQTLLQIH
ncbi:hypothetical protein GCM10023168_05450 [Fodinibacter luteus]|uniref:Uncharacterized protein n=1 Tax=Fodinibacter luteus TaxID=552064 RepID=A0ABP8K0N0_9MICO